MSQTEAIIGLFASVIGGVVVAVVNYLLTRDKTNAEIDKIRLEISVLQRQSGKISDSEIEADYHGASEKIIYYGAKRMDPFDIRGDELTYTRDREVVIIKKLPSAFYLDQYSWQNEKHNYLPAIATKSGDRKLRVSYQARAQGGAGEISVSIESHLGNTASSSGNRLDTRREKIEAADDFQKIQHFYRITPNYNCVVKFEFESLMRCEGFQIKNLEVAEQLG